MLLEVLLLLQCRLDHGAGKEIDLTECPRKKLKKQCVKYLGPVCASINQIQNIYWTEIEY